MVDFLITVVGLPFLLGGAVFLWYGGRLSIGLVRRSRQTRTVEATIVDISVTETDEDVYEPTVRFRYHHDGQRYESTQVREGRDPPSGPRRVVDSFLEDYTEGETVTATLLTSTPDDAVLEPATDTWPYVVAGTTTLIGAVFALLGAGISVSGLLA